MFIYWLIVTLFLVGIGHLLVYEGTLSIPEKKKINTPYKEEEKYKKN